MEEQEEGFLSDYKPMTEMYDFQIEYDISKGGKYACAKKDLKKDENILIEMPLVVWPISASISPQSISFCENCMKIKPYKKKGSSLHSSSSSSSLSETTSQPSSVSLSSSSSSSSSPSSSISTSCGSPSSLLSSPHGEQAHNRLSQYTSANSTTTASHPQQTPPLAPTSTLSQDHRPSENVGHEETRNLENQNVTMNEEDQEEEEMNERREDVPEEEQEEGIDISLKGDAVWFCSLQCLTTALGGDALISLSKIEEEEEDLDDVNEEGAKQNRKKKRNPIDSKVLSYVASSAVDGGCLRQATTSIVKAHDETERKEEKMNDKLHARFLCRKRHLEGEEMEGEEQEEEVGHREGGSRSGMDESMESTASSSSSAVAHNKKSTNNSNRLVGGWMDLLPPSSLRRLREKSDFYDSSVTPDQANPLPIESVARVIARIVSQAKTLMISYPHISLEESLSAALRPFQRLSISDALLQQENTPSSEINKQEEERETTRIGSENGERKAGSTTRGPRWCTYTSTMSEWREQRSLLCDVLSDRIQDTLHSSTFRDMLLSEETLLYIRKCLAVNCQALNLWGASQSTGELMVLRAGGVYTLHSCFNHSCDPNCSVSTSGQRGEGAILTIFTLRDIKKGEELNHCYLDGACSVERRREILYETYGFLCNCERCLREGGVLSAPPS